MVDEKDAHQVRMMNQVHIEKIKKQVGEIQRSFLAIKKSGIHRDILIAYIKDKSGMGKNDIATILDAQDEFYAKLSKLAE